ncbi:MAG: purine-nucleoside phosphorylase [Bacteroidales bacterium]|nr:purine-nucleoside phosphorylase [Bacteroidales bacterium]
MYEHSLQAAEWIKRHCPKRPEIAVVLGSGLGALVNDMTEIQVIPYREIPHFPVSTVEGHNGNLVFGRLGDKEVMVMQGRFHYYEGYSMKELAVPIRTMKLLGIKTLLLSNAAGGLNPDYRIGDIMVLQDHINLFPENPLRGKNDDRIGPRFPDMTEVYSKRLRNLADQVAEEYHIKLQRGVFVGWQGPSFETPAEYRMLRSLGADAVSMSTVPEAIIARHAGLEVFGISVITNVAQAGEENSHKEVQDAAGMAQPRMTLLFKELISKL